MTPRRAWILFIVLAVLTFVSMLIWSIDVSSDTLRALFNFCLMAALLSLFPAIFSTIAWFRERSGKD